ncbi:MAG: hypothetical protein JNM00_12785 [Flavobacteriales bacterium]|nr:hypothetical protein [Flavobacteriales bacterium]
MKNVILIATGLLMLVAFTSCEREPSSSVDQDKIWTKYEIVYDKNTGKTIARAEFRFSNALGTKLELSDPAEVTFNGTVMPFNSTTAVYEIEMNGLTTSGVFEYTDLDNNVYTNTTDQLELVEFPDGEILVQGGVDYVLDWSGDPIGSSDLVTVNLSDKVFSTGITGATSITLGGVQTDDITPGPHIGYMWRTLVREPDDATPEGGTIWLTYKAFNKAVTVQ